MKNYDFLENDVSKKERKSKNIKKIIIFIILTIIISTILYSFIMLVKNPSNTYVVTNGELLSEDSKEGYVIREETIVEGNNSGKEMNKELWEELYEFSKKHKIEFIKVKGHSDNEFNNRCDELARNAIDKL